MQFSPSYCIARASPLPLDVGCLFLMGSYILLLMVQQRVVILDFLQEKRSAYPFTPPSCSLLCLLFFFFCIKNYVCNFNKIVYKLVPIYSPHLSCHFGGPAVKMLRWEREQLAIYLFKSLLLKSNHLKVNIFQWICHRFTKYVQIYIWSSCFINILW